MHHYIAITCNYVRSIWCTTPAKEYSSSRPLSLPLPTGRYYTPQLLRPPRPPPSEVSNHGRLPLDVVGRRGVRRAPSHVEVYQTDDEEDDDEDNEKYVSNCRTEATGVSCSSWRRRLRETRERRNGEDSSLHGYFFSKFLRFTVALSRCSVFQLFFHFIERHNLHPSRIYFKILKCKWRQFITLNITINK